MTARLTTGTRRHRGHVKHESFLCALCASLFFTTFILLSPKTALSEDKCRTDSPYYFSEFNPSSWKVENELNYEEVYKNFEYFEVSFSNSCDEITVKKYVKGGLKSSERYRLNANGSLFKIDSN